ncbi:MAG TPA: tyrosine-type recombinase/integrase [bacterium]|nr:tyrosine-type recombinase/integrase [bacterium]
MARAFLSDRREEIQVWRHKIAIDHLMAIIDPETPASEITPQQIHTFRDELFRHRCPVGSEYQIEQAARRGVNNDLRHLRSVFRWAYKQGLIPSHPFDRVQLYKAARTRPDVLTREELKSMAAELSGEDLLAFHILRFTGLRIGELCALEWRDIDLKANLIRLQKTKNMDEAVVPIHPELSSFLSPFLDIKQNNQSPGRVIKLKSQTISRHFRAAMTRAGIFKKMPCHIFRHTAGRRILEAYYTTGNAQQIAKKFLRHKTDLMTQHYQQVYTDDLREAMLNVDL